MRAGGVGGGDGLRKEVGRGGGQGVAAIGFRRGEFRFHQGHAQGGGGSPTNPGHGLGVGLVRANPADVVNRPRRRIRPDLGHHRADQAQEGVRFLVRIIAQENVRHEIAMVAPQPGRLARVLPQPVFPFGHDTGMERAAGYGLRDVPRRLHHARGQIGQRRVGKNPRPIIPLDPTDHSHPQQRGQSARQQVIHHQLASTCHKTLQAGHLGLRHRFVVRQDRHPAALQQASLDARPSDDAATDVVTAQPGQVPINRLLDHLGVAGLRIAHQQHGRCVGAQLAHRQIRVLRGGFPGGKPNPIDLRPTRGRAFSDEVAGRNMQCLPPRLLQSHRGTIPARPRSEVKGEGRNGPRIGSVDLQSEIRVGRQVQGHRTVPIAAAAARGEVAREQHDLLNTPLARIGHRYRRSAAATPTPGAQPPYSCRQSRRSPAAAP